MTLAPAIARSMGYHHEFIPVCQYPTGFEVEEKEIGMFAKTKDGEIIKVKKRIFSK